MNKKFIVPRHEAINKYNTKIKIRGDNDIIIKEYSRQFEKIKPGLEVCLTEEEINEKMELMKKKIETFETNKLDNNLQEIRKDSLNRTRDKLLDYTFTNGYKFKSFITLTFKDNIEDINYANKKFQNYIDQVRRYEKKKGREFFYIGVPEFQNRGAVHYHILTSLECNQELIEKKSIITVKGKNGKYRNLEYYNLKYWNEGFSSAFDIIGDINKDFNIGLYITKYLYKDLGNKLWINKKLLKSNNLIKPSELNLDKESEEYKQAIEYIEKKGYVLKYSNYIENKSNNKYIPDITILTYKKNNI